MWWVQGRETNIYLFGEYGVYLEWVLQISVLHAIKIWNKYAKTSEASGSVSSLYAFPQHMHGFQAGADLSLLCSVAEKSIWPVLTRLGFATQNQVHKGQQQWRFLDYLHLFKAAEYFK